MQAGLQQNNALAEKAAASYQKASMFEAVRSRMEEHGLSFSGDISNLMQERLGIGRAEFTGIQHGAEQGDGAALQKIQGWVDTFVGRGYAAELVGLQAAPTDAGVNNFNAANRADVTGQGNAGVQGLLSEGAGRVGQASGTAGLDVSSTAPIGYQAIRDGTQAGMGYDRGNIQTGKADIQQEHDAKAGKVKAMADMSATEGALHRTSDNVLAVVPPVVGNALKFADKGMVDSAATASGLSRGVAGAVERAATGQEQDWNADYGYGFNRVERSPLLSTDEQGTTKQIYNDLFGSDGQEGKKSPMSDHIDQPHGNPVSGGGRVSSEFGVRHHPVDGVWKQHTGIDIAAPRGTPVEATADGVVKFSGEKGGYGNLVIIDHANGMETRYGHLDSFALNMREGQTVSGGDRIGTVGSTGKSTGNHLHYEVRVDGQAVNPRKFMG